jgi:putative heme iron utilization protein
MAMHTQNLKATPQASLFVAQTTNDGDPLGAARATLVGFAEPAPDSEVASASEQYLARHENSRSWVDFADFSFFRLRPIDIYFVGGFGVMGWVSAEDYARAEPDPLSSSGPGIIAHMNAGHVAEMTLLARTHAGIEAIESTMTSVDRLGFYLRLKTSEGIKGARVNFLREVATAGQAREVLVEMVQQAKAGPDLDHIEEP